jgi:hypothetical protein
MIKRRNVWIKTGLLLACTTSIAFPQWLQQDTVVFHADLEAATPLDNRLLTALEKWNAVSRMKMDVVQGKADPCDLYDGLSTWGWSEDNCGRGWGIVNSPFWGWSAFDSPQQYPLLGPCNLTFNTYVHELLSEDKKQWVALHETGHCLGLYHSSYEDSVMYKYYTGRLQPTQRDIANLRELYGSNVPPLPLAGLIQAIWEVLLNE